MVSVAKLASYACFGPGLAAGLFVARVIGEWIGLPGWWAAVLLAMGFGAAGAWLLSRLPVGRTWPGLLLLAYVIYPEPAPAFALNTGLVALFALLLSWQQPTGRGRTAEQSDFDARSSRLLAALLAISFFALYAWTLAPDVLAADSGELQVVAAQLGVAHPPGFPLYTVLAHLATRLLPFVSPACAVNLFSAATSALTVAVVYLAGAALTRRRLPGLIAALLLGTATTFWSQATTANVRSLTGLFAALILYALILFRDAKMRGDEGAADRRLVWAALAMGFGLTHHVSLLFLVGVGLLFVVIVDPSFAPRPRRWGRPLAAGLLGLLPLLYLPLRAATDVRGASPALATWPGFLEHALATGFRGDLFYYLTPPDLWQRLRIMGNVLAFQFEWIALAAVVIGLLLLLWRDRALAWLLGGTLAVFTLVAATYRAPQTVEYMIPGYVAAVLLAACAVGGVEGAWALLGRWQPVAWSLFAALLVVGGLNQLANNQTAAGANHEATSARDFAAPLLAEAPPDAVILAHWHWATPLWYLQEVEGMRPDVKVRFVFPEGESYDATWERRTRDAFAAGRPVITTWLPATPLAGLPPPEPLGEALLFPQTPRATLPDGFTPAVLSLSDAIEVIGYQLEGDPNRLELGEVASLTIAWRADNVSPGATLFAHLVGANGDLYGQDDRSAVRGEGVMLTLFRIVSREGGNLGPATVYIGASDNTTAPQRHPLTQVTIVPAETAPFTQNPVHRRVFDPSGPTLLGYDWDHTLPEHRRLYLHWRSDAGHHTQVIDDAAIDSLSLPRYIGPWGVPVSRWRFPRGQSGGHYVPFSEGIIWTGETLDGLRLAPGESVVVDQALHSSRPLDRDYVISVRLIGLEPDEVHWAWWDLVDSIPAMGAIPTLKWIDGSTIISPHRLTAAETATPGQPLTGALTIYDAFTNRPLPILDERLTNENPWVPLGRGVVE